MSAPTNKEIVRALAESLLRDANQKNSAPAAKTAPTVVGGQKVLYWAANGPYRAEDEDECMVFRPNMPCYFRTKTPYDLHRKGNHVGWSG